VTINHLLFKTK